MNRELAVIFGFVLTLVVLYGIKEFVTGFMIGYWDFTREEVVLSQADRKWLLKHFSVSEVGRFLTDKGVFFKSFHVEFYPKKRDFKIFINTRISNPRNW